jgi:hypothetical protein
MTTTTIAYTRHRTLVRPRDGLPVEFTWRAGIHEDERYAAVRTSAMSARSLTVEAALAEIAAFEAAGAEAEYQEETIDLGHDVHAGCGDGCRHRLQEAA